MLRPTYEVKTVPVYKKKRQFDYTEGNEIERYDFEITVKGDFDAEDVKEIDTKFPGARFKHEHRVEMRYSCSNESDMECNIRFPEYVGKNN